MMNETYKKERYAIPTFNFGGSTRSSTSPFSSTGDTLYVVSGATGVYITINGTRAGSTKLVQEQFCSTISSSAGGIASQYTNWTSVLGLSLTDKYGMNMTTQLVEVSVYGVSTNGGSTDQVAYTSSGCKGTKMVAFSLQGSDVTYNNVSGNAYVTTRVPINTSTQPTSPTSTNSFKIVDSMLVDQRVRDYILFNSDTGGAVGQLIVWEG